jgi:RNA polymerase sigma-70 factor (ECF subfamily)
MQDERGSASAAEVVLVLRARGGDAAAFGELVERYHERVGYYLRKMLSGGDRAEDAGQELWIDVYRSLGKLREPGAFGPWVYRLARDRAYRELRKRRVAVEGGMEDLVGDGKTPEDAYFRAEDAGRVNAGLEKLSVGHREVLLLRFVEGMSYPEIARVTGCGVGTVRSRLHYGKRALKDILEKEMGHDGTERRSGVAAD